MQINRMSYAHHTIVLSQEQDVTALQEAILRAIRLGGGAVSIIPAGGGRTLSLMMTPGVPVLFETTETPKAMVAGSADETDFVAIADWDVA